MTWRVEAWENSLVESSYMVLYDDDFIQLLKINVVACSRC
jgi:hypothetical protein